MNPIFQIIKETWSFKKYYFATSFLIITISLLNLANPTLSGRIVDEIVKNIHNGTSDFSTISILLGLMIGADVMITFLTNFSGYIGDILSIKLNTFLTSKFYKHVLSLEIEYFDDEVSGKIVNKLQRGIENIASFIQNMLNNFIPFFLTALFTIIYLAFYSIEIAILLAILFPIYIIISEKSSKAWMKKQDKINGIADILNGRIFESITSIRIVKSFIKEKLEHKNYLENRRDIEQIGKDQSAEWHKFDVIRRLMLDIVLFGIYVYIVYFTFQGRYTIGEMTLLIQLVNQARWPLFAMSYILGQLQQVQAGSKDFFEVLNRKVNIKDKDNAIEITDIKGDLEFNDVTFGYKNGKDVLHNIGFKLRSGQKLALVGESGEGKSTITNLLLRFYEPKSGEIVVDGKNIQDVTQESLHKNISVVLQDSILFSGTIEDNIKYGKDDATPEEVVEAAKAANAHEFITSFESGYKTEVGERGVKLSGGQKQRISIARAILKNAPILVLDEATSSLDSKAEKEVQKALTKLMEGKTTIIIAHRLATIKDVDHIIVLKSGRIEEEGSPQELIRKGGIYAELVQLQTSVTNIPTEEGKLKEFELVG